MKDLFTKINSSEDLLFTTTITDAVKKKITTVLIKKLEFESFKTVTDYLLKRRDISEGLTTMIEHISYDSK